MNLLLDELQLKYVIHNEVLLITSPAKANSEEFLETRLYDVADLVVYQDENGKKFDDYGPLTELIPSSIDSKSWHEDGGCGSIHGMSLGTAKVLVVSNRYDVHKKIAALLAEDPRLRPRRAAAMACPIARGRSQ